VLAAERGAVGVFVAPQCAASRCPWMSALLVPVVRVPSCARGPPCVIVYCTCTTNLYYSTVGRYKKRADTNEPRTNEIPFNIKDFRKLPPSR
jgi:hypothetical protein